MVRKITFFLIFSSFLSQFGCKEAAGEATVEESVCANCNDIFLDPMYNHFYTTDRTQPFTGKCQSFNKKGQLTLEKNFVKGKLEGKYFEYYDNGQLKSDWEFLKNRQHGNIKGYAENGTLMYHSIYYKGDFESSVYP